MVAPDRERSASGHAITIHRPLFPVRVEIPAARCPCFSVTGTPVDSTKLAIEELLPRRPDLVISGVNRGSNLGTDVLYSGTVSAAIEGTILGAPAIAASLCSFQAEDFAFAAAFVRQLARKVLTEGLPPRTLLNVNIPAVPPAELVGVAVTRLGIRAYKNSWDRRTDPRGKIYYWLAGEVAELHNEPDTDVVAVQRNLISVTPIQLDLTDRAQIERLNSWNLEGMASGAANPPA